MTAARIGSEQRDEQVTVGGQFEWLWSVVDSTQNQTTLTVVKNTGSARQGTGTSQTNSFKVSGLLTRPTVSIRLYQARQVGAKR